MTSSVQHLRGPAIDRIRWDAAVAQDPTGLPYGLSWWLDAVTDGRWGGLVGDDYRWVLPLPYRRKFGRLTQVQRPPFTQQCGPFGQVTGPDLALALQHLPAGTVQFALSLREGFRTDDLPAGFNSRQRTNLVLDLSPPRPTLQTGFHRDLRRKLKKFGPATLSLADIDTVVALYRPSAGQKAGLKEHHYARLLKLHRAAESRGLSLCYRLDEAEHGLLAAGFFPSYRGRIINLFAASSAAGYAREGMARLLAAILEKHGGPGKLFDFEGSDLPGVAEFFQSFGPEKREYLALERKTF
ncbi:hypothetical protein QWY85_00220 [Neolewinella lacunae]|uniref:GNAT family N-acetyltransferase n=1 Tax=Neolewinella lacunae TaxID=1517758 RepID=A0A923T9B5_9BACT|nr:hypothetical protein [Neolewinella lacunae]MBC6995349.1 hypothetical protein [Neolewinella lacunae]MDN3633061.1 hypothetical protein [Neolewinella lacunae]